MTMRMCRTGLAAIVLTVVSNFAPAVIAQDVPPRGAVSEQEHAATIQQARRAQSAGRWEEAAAAWGGVVEFDSQNGEAVFNLGYCLHLAGHLEEALDVHMRAAEFEQYRGLALYNAGCAHALLGRPDSAIQALAAAQDAGYSLQNAMQDSDLDSLHSDARFQALTSRSAPGFLGRLRGLLFQAQTAYAQYSPEIERNLDTMMAMAEAQAQSLVATVMQDERLGPLAQRLMQMLGGGGPQPPAQAGSAAEAGPSPTIQQAQRLQQSGDWAKAAAAYGTVLERDPENATAACGRAYCLHMGGDYAAAIEAHQRAAQFPQIQGMALYNLGCAFALTGDADKAFEALRAAHEAGFDMTDFLATDADLDNLREDARFRALQTLVDGGL